jgi:hypothetical protein
MTERKCANCGKPLGRGYKARYCNAACKQLAWRKRHGKTLTPMERSLAARRMVETKRAKTVIRVCDWCHTAYTCDAVSGSMRRYCSDAHKQAAYRFRKAETAERCGNQ